MADISTGGAMTTRKIMDAGRIMRVKWVVSAKSACDLVGHDCDDADEDENDLVRLGTTEGLKGGTGELGSNLKPPTLGGEGGGSEAERG